MKKKKNFVDLDSKYYTEKNPLEITKKIKKMQTIEGDVDLMTLPNISFYVMRSSKYYKTDNNFAIYNKEDFVLIQEFKSKLYYIEIMNENAIILYNDSGMEIWTKNKRNIFIKSKSIEHLHITPNILIHSKLNLLLYVDGHGLSVWNIKEYIPQNITTNIKMPNIMITDVFFLNKEDLLGAHLFNYNYNSFYIYVFKMKDFSIVKKMKTTEKISKELNLSLAGNLIIKINENKIFCAYKDNIKDKTFFMIIKIPEFIIEKEEKKNLFYKFIIYKNYLLFYSFDRNIIIIESSKWEFVKKINTRGFLSIIYLKDNYFLGLIREYALEKDLKSLVKFKLNL